MTACSGCSIRSWVSEVDTLATHALIFPEPVIHSLILQEYVVSGSEDGCIRIFDPMLRIVAWYEDIQGTGGIRAVSFSTGVPPELAPHNVLNVPDFAVATSSGKVIEVRTGCFEEPLPEQRRGEVMMESTPQVCLHLCPVPMAAAMIGVVSSMHLWLEPPVFTTSLLISNLGVSR